MTKFISFFLLTLVFLGCNFKDTEKQPLIKLNFFDSIQNRSLAYLDSLHLSRFNDSAKWLLYTIHCDDSASLGGVAMNHFKVEKKPLSFLPLKLSLIDKQNDTLSLLYWFVYDNDSIRVEEINFSHKTLSSGVVFDLKGDSVIGYIHGEGIYMETGRQSRYKGPLQPDVKIFLTQNKEKIDPWLRKEALRRNVLR